MTKKPKKKVPDYLPPVVEDIPVETGNLISFDIFFNHLLKINKKIKAHHYLPLKQFCEREFSEATLEEWTKTIEKY